MRGWACGYILLTCVSPLVCLLKIYKQFPATQWWGCQLHPAVTVAWWHGISPLCCFGLLLSLGSPSQPWQHQPTGTNSHSVSCLSTSEATEGHALSYALTATVTGSISMPKEIRATTLTNPWRRRTNTQIQMRVFIARFHRFHNHFVAFWIEFQIQLQTQLWWTSSILHGNIVTILICDCIF